MIICDHRFLLLFQQPEGQVLGQLPLAPNWEPAVEWAAFAALRAGGQEASANGRVVPIADERLGLPYVSGFRIELDGGVPHPPACDFPSTFFARDARRGSEALVERKKLREGDKFCYRLLAFAQTDESPAEPASPAFEVGEEVRPLALTEAPLAPLLEASVPADDSDGAGALHPVFIPQAVLDEAQTLVEAAGAREVGGILLGQLLRDASIPDLGVVVTAQIPARHALGEADKLTFTAETWAAVEAAIRLRQSEEVILGWWHSHPARFWCLDKKCSAEARRNCSLQRGFFSSDDLSLHESVFAKAFHLAVVVTHADDGCHHALYGWNQGVVQPRSFRVLRPGPPAGPPATLSPSDGERVPEGRERGMATGEGRGEGTRPAHPADGSVTPSEECQPRECL